MTIPAARGFLQCFPGQLNGGVHRRAVGDFVQKEHLVCPQPQGLHHPALHPLQGEIGEVGQVEVQQQPVLQHTEAQLGG